MVCESYELTQQLLLQFRQSSQHALRSLCICDLRERTLGSASFGNVGVYIELQDGGALCRPRQRELQGLIHPVQHCRIQVTRPISRQHHRKVPGLVPRPEQRRIQGCAQALHDAASTRLSNLHR